MHKPATFRKSLPKIEDGIQAAVHADKRRHLANGEQRAVNVGNGTVPRIVPDAEALVRHAEHDLGADHETGQAKRVDL